MAKSILKPIDRQAGREWDSYYEGFIAEVRANRDESPAQQRKRIADLEADPIAWNAYYFPKYCYAPPAKFHKKAVRRELADPELYEVRMWSRELAKDVVEMMITLYQVLAQKSKRNILLISNSEDKAGELINPYKLNLEANERIIHDYGIQQNPGNWRYGDFVTSQGVSFLAVGADQSPRGSRNEEVRPDKVIISDIDTDQDVLNEEIIKKRWRWFEKAVYGTRSISKPFQVIFLGNLIAKDCCIARATKMADHVDQINIVDKNSESSWPEKNTKEHIDRIRSKISTMAFEGEYMNNPLSEGSVFKEMRWGKVPPLKSFKFLVAYGDPAPSNSTNKKGSYKSVFLIGNKDGVFYVITGYLDHVLNKEFVTWYYNIKEFVVEKTVVYNYIENNKLQDPFFEQVFAPIFLELAKEKNSSIGVIGDTRTKPDKFSRIEGNLDPLNRSGRLILNEDEKENPHMKRLEDQFLLVDPKLSGPADGPDAIEGAVWIINQKLMQLSSTAITVGKKYENNKRY